MFVVLYDISFLPCYFYSLRILTHIFLPHHSNEKVLYIHQYFKITCNTSSIRSYEVAFALAQMATLSVLLLIIAIDLKFKTLLSVPNTDKFITVYTLPVSYSNKYSFTRRIFSFFLYSSLSTILALLLRSNLVYASSTPLTVAFPALVRRILFRTPYVLEVRDVWPDIPISMGFIRNSFLRFLIKIFSYIAYTHASKIIALSPDMKARLIRIIMVSIPTPALLLQTFSHLQSS